MTAPPPRHRPPAAPDRPRSPVRRWLRAHLCGRRRDVTLTEPVGPVRRWLQRLALPLVALAVVLGLLGGYLYVNGRINSLEQDRRDRTAARDRQQIQLKDQIDAAAEARTRKLELQLCELIVGTRVSPRVAKLRGELRCPAVPTGSAGPASATTASPSASAPTSATSPPASGGTASTSPATSPAGTPSATSSLPGTAPATPSSSPPTPSTRPPALSPLPSCPPLPPPCVLLQRCS